MKKKYIACLTDAERTLCDETIGNLRGSSRMGRRARSLREVDVGRPGWQDRWMAEAYGCRVQTVLSKTQVASSSLPDPRSLL